MTHRVPGRHAAPIPTTPFSLLRTAGMRRRTRQLGTATAAVMAASLGLVPLAATAASPHDPFGHLDRAVAVGQSAITVQGWAGDPDLLSQSLTISFTVDGATAGQVVSAVARPDASAARGVGPRAGFAASLPAGPGQHLVCASAGNVGAGVAGLLGCLSVSVAGLTPAIVAAHSPFGMLDHTAVSGTVLTVTGWAADPDALSQPLAISASVDARPAALTKLASQPRPDVVAARHTGPNQGYLLNTTIAANGLHTVCVLAANLWVGANKQLGCAVIRIGPVPLTAAQIAAHSPSGALQSAVAESATGLRVTGWASDPDNRAASLNVVGYLDGASARTVSANLARPDLVASKLAGARAGFSFAVPTAAGAHNICVWAVNIGIGTNRYLGCAALSTPAVAMPSGPAPAIPAANKKVTTLAASYVGLRYVWGAEDPKIGFDCSGLVQYTYWLAAGLSTPRVAQDQFRAARMIASGRAVPGDLVFFHDSIGSVYHVGIYAGPGTMYAAVDEAEGVRYQKIWDATATFASFTHS
ncbi:MAG: C40 family peptidase [Jatrophihabitans sp.]